MSWKLRRDTAVVIVANYPDEEVPLLFRDGQETLGGRVTLGASGDFIIAADTDGVSDVALIPCGRSSDPAAR